MLKVTKLKDNEVVEVFENVTGMKQAICPTHIHLRFEDSSLMVYVVGYDIKLEEVE